jgi:hypothetical protein
VSSTLPVTVDQCNGSANDGGAELNCSITMTTIVVDTTPTTTTTTTVSSSNNPSTAGESVTFTATVTAGNASTPTGSVEFFDYGTSLGTVALDNGGQASLTTTALPAGSDSITAVYLGAPGFPSSTSAVLTQVVNGVVSPVTTGSPPTTTGSSSGSGTAGAAVPVTPRLTG